MTDLFEGLAWADCISVHIPRGDKPAIGAAEFSAICRAGASSALKNRELELHTPVYVHRTGGGGAHRRSRESSKSCFEKSLNETLRVKRNVPMVFS